MLENDEEWTALSLRFHGDALEPEAVSRALELEPAYTGRRGEHLRGNPRYAVHESNIWTKSYEDSDCLRFAEQIAKLVSQLERKETEMREILISRRTATRGSGDRGRYAVISTNPPAQIDIIGDHGPNAGRTIRTIFAQSGGQLTVCYQLGAGDRPSAFQTAGGTQELPIRYWRTC